MAFLCQASRFRDPLASCPLLCAGKGWILHFRNIGGGRSDHPKPRSSFLCVASLFNISLPQKASKNFFLNFTPPPPLSPISAALYFFPFLLFFFSDKEENDSWYEMKITCSYTLDVVIVGECREPPNEEERHLLIIFRIRISPKI